ncbi:hypothetical protein JCM18899A_00590 [Nocardioides sp. AN3]
MLHEAESSPATVLAVGLGDASLAAVRHATAGPRAASLTTVEDAHRARDWLARHRSATVLVVARFHEADAWGLCSLLVTLLERSKAVPVVVVSPVPRPSLPVLITDHPGLVVVDPADQLVLCATVETALERCGTHVSTPI